MAKRRKRGDGCVSGKSRAFCFTLYESAVRQCNAFVSYNDTLSSSSSRDWIVQDPVCSKEDTSTEEENPIHGEDKHSLIFKEDLLLKYISEFKGCRYVEFQVERCATTQRVHVQGWMYVKTLIRVNEIIKHLFKSHVEICLGSFDQNKVYCTKNSTRVAGPWSIGEMPKQGKRNDIIAAAAILRDGGSLRTVAESHPTVYLKYASNLAKMKFIFDTAKRQEFRHVTTTVIFGPTSTGKSRFVIDKYGPENVYKLDSQSKSVWFDGYDGEDVLLIDDFYGWIKHGFLLNILDGHKLRLDVKGAHTWAGYTKIYITSNKHPKDWYPKLGFTYELDRRIHTLIDYAKVPRMNYCPRVEVSPGYWTSIGQPSIPAPTDPDEEILKRFVTPPPYIPITKPPSEEKYCI